MPLPTRITDGNGTGTEAQLKLTEFHAGLKCFTAPLRDESSAFRPYVSDDFGIEMNQDAAFTGTPQLVHDGTDNAGWTGSDSGTRITFNSTGQAFDGTQSVYHDRIVLNEIATYDKGANVDLSNYSAITMQIYVENNWAAGDSMQIYGYDTGTASEVGDRVNLEDYFNFGQFGEWLPITIPLTDMNLEAQTVDAFRIECVATSGTRPRWYMDVFNLQETGGGYEFISRPSQGTIFRATALHMLVTGTFAQNDWSWDEFFGLTKLTNGINYQRFQDSRVRFNFSTRCYQDLTWVGFQEYDPPRSDATETTLSMRVTFSEPAFLDSRDSDYGVITIQDDLSSLSTLRFALVGREEGVTNL